LKALVIGLSLLATAAFAQDTGNYNAVGTAYRDISTTLFPQSYAYTTATTVIRDVSTSYVRTYRVVCTSDCNILIAPLVTPTVIASSTFYPAYTPEYVVIPPYHNAAVRGYNTSGAASFSLRGR